MRTATVLLLLISIQAGCASAGSNHESLIVTPALSSPSALNRFYVSIDEAWKITETEAHGASLELIGGGIYKPPHRSPSHIALLSSLAFGDFTLDVDALQTGKEYGHRDLCIFFGFADPAHYYYVHLATTPDDHACNIFLVDGAPRRRIAAIPAKGVDWGADEWHRIRVARRGGKISVYFDDLAKPILEAKDETHGVGHVGVGSFDDTGRFANLRILSDTAHERVLQKNPFAP